MSIRARLKLRKRLVPRPLQLTDEMWVEFVQAVLKSWRDDALTKKTRGRAA